MEYFSTTRKKEILPFATTRMDLEDIMLSEMSQTEKDRYCMISLTMWNLKKPDLYREEWWLPRARDGGTGEMLKATNFQLKHKFEISNAQHSN